MAICIKCGKEASSCLCDSCRTGTDLEQLCRQVIGFRPGTGENPLWEEICSGMNSPYNFSNLVFALSDELPTPRKEYLRVMAIAGSSSNVPKASRPWFYEIYDAITGADGLTEAENEEQEQHGEERLLELMRNDKFVNAESTVNMILDDVADHVGSADQSDDLTILCLKIG